MKNHLTAKDIFKQLKSNTVSSYFVYLKERDQIVDMHYTPRGWKIDGPQQLLKEHGLVLSNEGFFFPTLKAAVETLIMLKIAKQDERPQKNNLSRYNISENCCLIGERGQWGIRFETHYPWSGLTNYYPLNKQYYKTRMQAIEALIEFLEENDTKHAEEWFWED